MHVDDAQEARLKLLVPFVLFTAALAVSASASAQSAGPGGNPGAASADHAAAQAKKLFRLANFLIHEHQPEAACKILEDTTAPAALQANRLYLMSHCLRDQGKTDEAIKTLEEVVTLLPNAATPRVELATLYLNQGKLRAAHTQLIAAAQYDTDPDSTLILRHDAEQLGANDRSEERRVGKECGRTCRSRWSTEH